MRSKAHLYRRLILPTLLAAVALCPWTKAAESQVGPITAIVVAFKFDPGATYGGVHWISPPAFTSGLQSMNEGRVEARVVGVDARGSQVKISPQWIASEPDMVTVTPVSNGVFDQVLITVKRVGECKLTVKAQARTKEMMMIARAVGPGMQVKIVQ